MGSRGDRFCGLAVRSGLLTARCGSPLAPPAVASPPALDEWCKLRAMAALGLWRSGRGGAGAGAAVGLWRMPELVEECLDSC